MKYLVLIIGMAVNMFLFGCGNSKENTGESTEADTIISNSEPANRDTVTVKLDPVVEDTTIKE